MTTSSAVSVDLETESASNGLSSVSVGSFSSGCSETDLASSVDQVVTSPMGDVSPTLNDDVVNTAASESELGRPEEVVELQKFIEIDDAADEEGAGMAANQNADLAFGEGTGIAVDENSNVAVDENSNIAVDENSNVAVDENSITAVDENSNVAVDENSNVAVGKNLTGGSISCVGAAGDSVMASNPSQMLLPESPQPIQPMVLFALPFPICQFIS